MPGKTERDKDGPQCPKCSTVHDYWCLTPMSDGQTRVVECWECGTKYGYTLQVKNSFTVEAL